MEPALTFQGDPRMSPPRVVRRGAVTAVAFLAIVATTGVLQLRASPAAETPPRVSGHPRLYFTPAELAGLQAARGEGFRAVIWANLVQSADWCLTRPLRKAWIAPVTPDPISANLYDRFTPITTTATTRPGSCATLTCRTTAGKPC